MQRLIFRFKCMFFYVCTSHLCRACRACVRTHACMRAQVLAKKETEEGKKMLAGASRNHHSAVRPPLSSTILNSTNET